MKGGMGGDPDLERTPKILPEKAQSLRIGKIEVIAGEDPPLHPTRLCVVQGLENRGDASGGKEGYREGKGGTVVELPDHCLDHLALWWVVQDQGGAKAGR